MNAPRPPEDLLTAYMALAEMALALARVLSARLEDAEINAIDAFHRGYAASQLGANPQGAKRPAQIKPPAVKA
jgi:hypothetical protein